MATSQTKADRMNLRVSPAAKQAISKAAALRNQTLSEFVVDAAVDRAETVLADRSRFELDDEQWNRFQEALDRPAVANVALARLLSEPSVLEQP